MKKEIGPGIVAVIVIVVVAVVGFFLWKGTSGPGSKPPGSVGNPGPFAPGGAAVGKGGGMPAAAEPRTGAPGAPR